MLNRFLPKIDPNPAFSKKRIISQTNNVIASSSALDRMDGGNKFETTLSSPPLKVSIKSDTKMSLTTFLFLTSLYVSEITATTPKQRFSGDFQDLDAQIETMMCRGENVLKKLRPTMFIAYVCRVCGKEGQNNKIKDHIEVNHLEGVSVFCNLCNKLFRLKHAQKVHISRHHN